SAPSRSGRATASGRWPRCGRRAPRPRGWTTWRGEMAAGSGLAPAAAPADAALEAALEALERSGADGADLVLVFATGDTYPAVHEMLHAIRRVTGARVVVGCSGTGVLT